MGSLLLFLPFLDLTTIAEEASLLRLKPSHLVDLFGRQDAISFDGGARIPTVGVCRLHKSNDSWLTRR